MRALALYGDVEAVHRCRQHACTHTEHARGPICGKMQAEHGVHAIRRTCAYQLHRAAWRELLRVLKKEPRFAGKGCALRRKELGKAKEHGGVAVVPAGMHYAGAGGCIGKAARLLDGERVDIPAYAEDGLAPILFAPDACHKAGLRWPGNGNARHGGKELRQVGGRFKLFKGKLRVAVQMLLPCVELGNDAGYTRVKRHMDSPSRPRLGDGYFCGSFL